MATKLLDSIGIAMPDDFPIAPFETILARVIPHQGTSPEAVTEYFGAQNGVAYRFRACCEYSDHFLTVRDSTAEGRHLQEKDLFGFFVSGFSVIESFCYGAFMVGAIVEPSVFPIGNDKKLRRITPDWAASRFGESKLKCERVTMSLKALIANKRWNEWTDVRRVLAHRQTPGRLINLGGPPSIWKVGEGVKLDAITTTRRRRWLANMLARLSVNLDSVAQKHL